MVIATGLANAHGSGSGSGQHITGLVALALVFIHDAMIRKR